MSRSPWKNHPWPTSVGSMQCIERPAKGHLTTRGTLSASETKASATGSQRFLSNCSRSSAISHGRLRPLECRPCRSRRGYAGAEIGPPDGSHADASSMTENRCAPCCGECPTDLTRRAAAIRVPAPVAAGIATRGTHCSRKERGKPSGTKRRQRRHCEVRSRKIFRQHEAHTDQESDGEPESSGGLSLPGRCALPGAQRKSRRRTGGQGQGRSYGPQKADRAPSA